MTGKDTSQPGGRSEWAVAPDGKVDATITRVYPTHAFALDAYGQSYFIFHNACEMMGRFAFEDLRMGSQVRLRPVMNKGRGLRGIEVQILAI
jgi:hypothetical protein